MWISVPKIPFLYKYIHEISSKGNVITQVLIEKVETWNILNRLLKASLSLSYI